MDVDDATSQRDAFPRPERRYPTADSFGTLQNSPIFKFGGNGGKEFCGSGGKSGNLILNGKRIVLYVSIELKNV